MDAFDRLTLEEIAAAIPDGALLGVPAYYSGVPMAATRALIARGARDLRLFCLPYTTLQGDMLIGAGCVASVEAAAVTLGEHGLAPRFTAGFESGAFEIRASTCPALPAQLQGTAKGRPLLPPPGGIGSAIAAPRPHCQRAATPILPRHSPRPHPNLYQRLHPRLHLPLRPHPRQHPRLSPLLHQPRCLHLHLRPHLNRYQRLLLALHRP